MYGKDVNMSILSDNKTNTVDSEIMDESQNHENSGSEMDSAQLISWFVLWLNQLLTKFRKLACYLSNLTIWILFYFVNSLFWPVLASDNRRLSQKH